MKNKLFINVFRVLTILGVWFLICDCLYAQEMPPRPVSISLERNLSFGAFSQSMGGGSVIVYSSGSRTSTGNILLVNLGYMYYPALFKLEGNPGTVVHFMAGPDAILYGNHGGTMTMKLGESEPLSPFILSSSPNGAILVFIGGTLVVGNPLANPPGNYSGSFIVMFLQE
ncbi:MAG: DUF4402 domain-containing protein [Bacteroidetes bacterium]|nr:DUF4402 domain-containing protein [Bacteroidota bacterium]